MDENLKVLDPVLYKRRLNVIRVQKCQQKKRTENIEAFKEKHRLVEAKSKIVRQLKKEEREQVAGKVAKVIDRSNDISEDAMERLACVQAEVKKAAFKMGEDRYITIAPEEHLVAGAYKQLSDWLKEQNPPLYISRVRLSEADITDAGIKRKVAYYVGIGTTLKAAKEGACALDDKEEEAAGEEKGDEEGNTQEGNEGGGAGEEGEDVAVPPPAKKAKK